MISHGDTSTVGTEHCILGPVCKSQPLPKNTGHWYQAAGTGILQFSVCLYHTMLELVSYSSTVLAHNQHTCLLTLYMKLDGTGKLSVVRPSRLSLDSVLGHTQSGSVLSVRCLMCGLHRVAHTDHQSYSRLVPCCSSRLLKTMQTGNDDEVACRSMYQDEKAAN